MVGGLMNIASYGSENIILTGNPTKTMFKAVYHKYTNFGMQRFRLDYKGLRNLSFTQETNMVFMVKRYGDLIGDTYIVINLPNIWSPFVNTAVNAQPTIPGVTNRPLESQWIEDLGVQMIKNISILAGGTKLQDYPGEYLYCMVERDFNNSKKDLWNRMIGNVPELNDPGNANGNVNRYPNAAMEGLPTPITSNIEPSIRGRQLYIPIDAWFCGSSKLALPLVALQYQEVEINITFRPIRELYTILDVVNPDAAGLGPRIAPNPNDVLHQLWRFLQPPPTEAANTADYTNLTTDWNADIHLMANYYFLEDDERRVFAQSEHNYLIKNHHHYDFLNATGSKIVDMDSLNMVASYMWRFRRSDANLRNQWSNYSNWPYNNVIPSPITLWAPVIVANPNAFDWTGLFSDANIKNILINLGIIIGGNYREVVMRDGVYNYLEKYLRTTGDPKDGLYCYNLCLNSNEREYQPTGAMNMNKFKYVQFEYNTIEPPRDASANIVNICDSSGNIIGVRKNTFDLYDYNFDLRVFEERYNMIVIQSGNIGLLYAQ